MRETRFLFFEKQGADTTKPATRRGDAQSHDAKTRTRKAVETGENNHRLKIFVENIITGPTAKKAKTGAS